MENTARPTGSKYDLANKAEVNAALKQVEAALADIRRTFAKAIDGLAERHVAESEATTAALESMHRLIKSVDEHVDTLFMRVAVRVADLEDRTLAARWRRALWRFRALFRDREAV